MSKGASKTGTQTTTVMDPLRQAQAPFLTGGWESARNLLEQAPQQPYPYQRVTEWGQPERTAGYQNMYNYGVNAGGIAQQAMNPFNAATSGQYGVENSPAYAGMQQMAGGYSPAQQQAMQNAQLINMYGQQGAGWGQSYGQGAAQTGQYAGNLGQQYGNQLQGIAGGIPGQVAPYGNQLQYNAQTAIGNNPAQNLLRQQASGAYLNSNPYLDQMYGSAADAVSRQYQTTTAPRTESSYEGAGRYGSPSARNAVSQNEQNLGKSLGNLASDIYGTNYGRERGLQNQATETLGSQYLSGLGQSTNAAQAGGNLGLGAAQAQLGGYNMAGNQALQGLQQQGQGFTQGGQLGLQGTGQAATAAGAAGQLDLANAQAQQRALEGLQSGYQQGNAQALAGAGLGGSMIANTLAGPEAMAKAGLGLASIDQPKIDAAMQQWKEQQAAPWTNLQNYMSLLGQPTGRSEVSQQPIYGSPLAQGIGMLGAGSNLLFGQNSGGLMGQLGGGGGGGGYNAGTYNGGPASASPNFGGGGDYSGTGGNYWGSGSTGGFTSGGDSGGGGGKGGGGKGIGGMIGSGLGAILSDRRLKEDIQQVGNLGPLPVHTFRYRGDPTRRVGFMADEVEQIAPSAVRMTNLGFKAVDYDAALGAALRE